MQRTFLVAGLVASLVAAPAAAQNVCAEYAQTPPLGSWSEWQSKDGKVRLAVIGTEKKEGKDLYWMEMQGAQTGPPGKAQKGIIQVLVGSFPYDAASVQGMVMKVEGQPAMKASEQMLSMMRSHMADSPASSMLRDCTSITKVGEETISVPAGSFKTVHLKDSKSGNDIWASKEVPFGLVKGSTAKSGEFVLVATGTGAKSSITETPMDMGAMMQHQ